MVPNHDTIDYSFDGDICLFCICLSPSPSWERRPVELSTDICASRQMRNCSRSVWQSFPPKVSRLVPLYREIIKSDVSGYQKFEAQRTDSKS